MEPQITDQIPPRFQDKQFILAVRSWPRGARVIIKSVSGTTIAQIPISFLRSCGHNTWLYVLDVVNLLVEQDVDHPGHVYDSEVQAVDIDSVPVGGTFRYLQQGVCPASATLVRILEHF